MLRILEVIAVVASSFFGSTALAQSPDDNIALSVAAIAAVHPKSQSEKLVIVATSPGETAVAAQSALRLGAKSRECFHRNCNEVVGQDSVAVRAHTIDVTPTSAIVLVDSWVRIPSQSQGIMTFGSRHKVLLKRLGGTWRVVAQTLQYES
jgi:hypothetical protein